MSRSTLTGRQRFVDVVVLAGRTPAGTAYTLATFPTGDGLIRFLQEGRADHARADVLHVRTERMTLETARALWPWFRGPIGRRRSYLVRGI